MSSVKVKVRSKKESANETLESLGIKLTKLSTRDRNSRLKGSVDTALESLCEFLAANPGRESMIAEVLYYCERQTFSGAPPYVRFDPSTGVLKIWRNLHSRNYLQSLWYDAIGEIDKPEVPEPMEQKWLGD